MTTDGVLGQGVEAQDMTRPGLNEDRAGRHALPQLVDAASAPPRGQFTTLLFIPVSPATLAPFTESFSPY